jgi:hypothetical protein
MKRRWFLSPGLVLFFLSPVIGELLSGSAPPAEFFNPLGFIMLAILYGGGAILVREMSYRWGKDWPALLVLGAAYGIAEEGLMCKSFFDPNWMDLGPLGSYGRWAGVNWVWALELTIYHCVFSIAIPILLVGILFPARRRQAWITKRELWLLFILWVENAAFIFLFISKFRPPVVHYLATMAVTAGLCALAWRMPNPVSGEKKKAVRAFWFLPVGFVGTIALFFLVWVVPKTGIHPLFTMMLMVGLAVVIGWMVLKMSGGAGWSERHQWALVSGALGFFILLAPLQEMDKNRADNTTGMGIVGLVMAVFLILIFLRVRSIEKGSAGSQLSCG